MPKPSDVHVWYHTFRDIIRLLHACTRVEEIAELVVLNITRAFESQGAILQLFDRGEQRLETSLAYSLGEAGWRPDPLAELPSIVALSQEKKVLTITARSEDPRFAIPAALTAQGIRMLLAAPLGLGEDHVGVLCLAFNQEREFSDEDLDFLAAIAQQCTCAIDKARLIEKQQMQFDRLAHQTERLTALGRMAAGVAHGLNNPLSSILLYSSNMKKKVPPEGFLHEGLDIIIQETKRCKTIIQDLQEFSRSKEPKKTVGNITSLLEKVINLLDSEFRRQNIRLHQESAGPLPDMWLDIGQMQQVFANLLINAVEAAGDKGEITVTTVYDPQQQSVVITIADNGPGIPPEQASRIFEPFFSTKPRGTGLGLAVTYGFITNHQGDIKIDSSPGKGTRFTIRLPVVSLEQEPVGAT